MSFHNTPKKSNSQWNGQQIQGLFPFWKKPGETLAVMLRRFRHEQDIDEKEKITYAGRLDPMAEGIVPLLVGDACLQKERFLALPKTYEVQILLGLGTDTGDMMGFPTGNPSLSTANGGFSLNEITTALTTLKQTVSLPYPNYSSRPVDGKPLFMHARAGNKVVLPIKKVSIYELELISIKEYPLHTLISQAIEIIETVEGDFRQKEIIEKWSQVEKIAPNAVQIITIRTAVSSGTYMRALAEKLGLLLKVPALAYSIKRVTIGGIE